MSVDCWDTDKVYSMYIAIIEALLNLGIVIPLTQCSKQAIAKELHKLKKQFDEDDWWRWLMNVKIVLNNR